jgi:hypothetical protein
MACADVVQEIQEPSSVSYTEGLFFCDHENKFIFTFLQIFTFRFPEYEMAIFRMISVNPTFFCPL